MKLNGSVWIGCACLLVVMASPLVSGAHDLHGILSASDSHAGEAKRAQGTAEPASVSNAASGQGEYRFRVLHGRGILPPEALAVLEKAHGGFAVDRREGRGRSISPFPEREYSA